MGELAQCEGVRPIAGVTPQVPQKVTRITISEVKNGFLIEMGYDNIYIDTDIDEALVKIKNHFKGE